jgi:hypothetical protein
VCVLGALGSVYLYGVVRQSIKKNIGCYFPRLGEPTQLQKELAAILLKTIVNWIKSK